MGKVFLLPTGFVGVEGARGHMELCPPYLAELRSEVDAGNYVSAIHL